MANEKGVNMSSSMKERPGTFQENFRRLTDQAGQYIQGFVETRVNPMLERLGFGSKKAEAQLTRGTTETTGIPVPSSEGDLDGQKKDEKELTRGDVIKESGDLLLTRIQTGAKEVKNIDNGISEMELRIQRYALHPVSVDSKEESIIATERRLNQAKEDRSREIAEIIAAAIYWGRLDVVRRYVTIDLPELPGLREEQRQLEQTVTKLDEEMKRYIQHPVSVGGESGRITDVEEKLRTNIAQLGNINGRVASILLDTPEEFKDGFDPEELKKPSHSAAERVYKETLAKLLQMPK